MLLQSQSLTHKQLFMSDMRMGFVYFLKHKYIISCKKEKKPFFPSSENMKAVCKKPFNPLQTPATSNKVLSIKWLSL